MENVDADPPEYINITRPACKEDVRDLLRELAGKGVTEKTKIVFVMLSLTKPTERLMSALQTVARLMEEDDIGDILLEGLTQEEREALAELDDKKLSRGVRRTARCLLCVKERFIFARRLSGIFRATRRNDGYLNVGEESHGARDTGQ